MDQALFVPNVPRLIVCQYVAVTKPPKVFSPGVRLPLIETTLDLSKKSLECPESRTERFISLYPKPLKQVKIVSP